MVADGNIQISAACELLFTIHLRDGGAQLVVGLDTVFRTVDITLQLRVAQVAQRVDRADQLVVLWRSRKLTRLCSLELTH